MHETAKKSLDCKERVSIFYKNKTLLYGLNPIANKLNIHAYIQYEKL